MPGFVKIIADSQNPDGVRLTTFEISFHLFIWAEVLTHRTNSRNAQSNRAIPSKKMLEAVRTDLALPYYYGKNQPGMAAKEELDPETIEAVQGLIKELAGITCSYVEKLVDVGLHKQIANRYLGPFQWMRTLVSATTWENYFALRDHPAAQPEIALPARWMKEALDKNAPKQLQWGEWHRPLINEEDIFWAGERDKDLPMKEYREVPVSYLNKLSIARCARVSYLNHLGTREPEKDLELYNTLYSSGHYSPFEHVAMADEQKRSVSNFDPSWLQYRKVVESNNPYFVL